MVSKRTRAAALLAAPLVLALMAGNAAAANPNASYDFSACWDDGTLSGTQGLVGLQSWSGIRANAASFNFENYAFAADYQQFSGTRSGSAVSGWFTPQNDGGAFQGWLYNGRRVVASGSIPEPAGGWATLPAC